MKDNMSRWLEKKAKVEKSVKNELIKKLFGEGSGLVYAQNEAEYQEKRAIIETDYHELSTKSTYLEKFGFRQKFHGRHH